MQANAASLWAPRLAAFAAMALLGASLVAWVLRWPADDVSAPGSAVANSPVRVPVAQAPDAVGLSRALGAAVPDSVASADGSTQSGVTAEQRLRLTGVLAGAPRGGAALIAVQDQAPRAFHIGSKVTEGLVLQAVSRRSASLGPNLQSPPQPHTGIVQVSRQHALNRLRPPGRAGALRSVICVPASGVVPVCGDNPAHVCNV